MVRDLRLAGAAPYKDPALGRHGPAFYDYTGRNHMDVLVVITANSADVGRLVPVGYVSSRQMVRDEDLGTFANFAPVCSRAGIFA